MRFKLIQGTHRIDKRTYNTGDVITTNKSLDVTFPERFTRLEESATKTPKPEKLRKRKKVSESSDS